MKANEIQIAFLGAGRMGMTHARNLATLNGVKVSVIADVNLPAAQAAQALTRAERATDDIQGAITAPDVDAVVIATPTGTHAALIEAAVRAGKPVWCEKPIALDLSETQRVVDVIHQIGAPVQLGIMRRFDPGYAAAKRKIETGEIGRVERFRAISCDFNPPPMGFIKGSGGIFVDMNNDKYPDLVTVLPRRVMWTRRWRCCALRTARWA
jgi:myo-inositol 2-dehydrogenase/D-chiro-inositol 1-dehydrogenase